MDNKHSEHREGSLEAPTRHPINWQDPDYYNQDSLFTELERVFDICHGCRRCVSLCHAFPTLFDLIDESETFEIDGVDKKDYWQVVDHCYLCDLCYMTKCPYVPPHPWNVDFPHLMLRAKANKHEQGKNKLRDRVLTSTDAVGRFAGIPVVAQTVNTVNKNSLARKVMEGTLGIHSGARLPVYHSDNARKRFARKTSAQITPEPTDQTRGKVAIFVTCYGNRNDPDTIDDMVRVFEHNNIPVRLTEKEQCCGMPKLELGDLKAVEKAKDFNIPQLLTLIEEGWDIVAAIPSCVLMFKQEIPLMFPEDEDIKRVQSAIFDPFEYLNLRHRAGKFNTDFKNPLGRIAYHAPCHQRVQNIGLKTRDLLELVPDTEIEIIERCSGHNGTYAVKSESHDISMKICRPVANRVKKAETTRFISDCPMAATQIEEALESELKAENPFSLLCEAYGIR
ncbi:MAG TPA: heterodisulfide reductase-related iron-sulfur binding cluster [Gammaproteobacteria bacterium]|nr:heterodisulfide reductase-related iron-sulfur binding cluster [Gammaproteobacteria bacterium]